MLETLKHYTHLFVKLLNNPFFKIFIQKKSEEHQETQSLFQTFLGRTKRIH